MKLKFISSLTASYSKDHISWYDIDELGAKNYYLGYFENNRLLYFLI